MRKAKTCFVIEVIGLLITLAFGDFLEGMRGAAKRKEKQR